VARQTAFDVAQKLSGIAPWVFLGVKL